MEVGSPVTDVWRSWVLNDPEPTGVTVVRDSSNVVSYADSPEWKRVIGMIGGPSQWRGYKQGEHVTLDWVELLLLWGPVTGKAPAANPEPELVEPAPPPVPAGSWPWWTSEVAS